MICVRQSALPRSACEAWLADLDDADESARPLSATGRLDAAEVLGMVLRSGFREALELELGPAPLCNLDQSWVRHGRPPHSWHQDGALRFDFLAHEGRPLPEDAVLEMRIVWIALTPCGERAPGLEWIDAPLDGLLRPSELAEDAVAARFGADRFVRPALAPGDALLFDGLLLHRTQRAAAMTEPRTSLELRFFRADCIPLRVAADRFLPLGGPATSVA